MAERKQWGGGNLRGPGALPTPVPSSQGLKRDKRFSVSVCVGRMVMMPLLN